MPNPISYAEMIAWLRHLAALGPGVAHGDVEMAEAVLTHLERPQWRPIEEAPRDGTPSLVYCPHATPFQIVAAYMRDGDRWEGWVDIYEGDDIWPPSHFMPLPPSPETPR